MARDQASFDKRRRELERKEQAARRLQKKTDRKAQAAAAAASGIPSADPDVDPDLVGMVAGPQPRPDDDEFADVTDSNADPPDDESP